MCFSLTAAHFFKAALKKNLSPGYLKEDLVQLGLSNEKAAWVAAKVAKPFVHIIMIHKSLERDDSYSMTRQNFRFL